MRGRTLIIALLVAALLAVPVVGGLLNLRTDTSPASFLPAGDPTLAGLEDVASSFGGDPIVVLLESDKPAELLTGEQLPKLLELEGRLAKLPDMAAVYGPATILNQIAGATRNLMATVIGRRDLLRSQAEDAARAAGKPPAAVEAAGKDATREFDVRYGGLLVRGLPAGLPTLRNPRFVEFVVLGQDGRPKPSFRYVVPNANSVAILARPRQDLDQEGAERLVAAIRATVGQAGLTTTRVTVTGAPAVAADLGEQVRREMPILGGVAVVLVTACYLLVPWVRGRRRRALPLLATLGATAVTLALFGWLDRPLSLGVIAFLPILIGVGSDFPAYLVRRAGKRRVLVTATASAAGFAALAVSPLPFVRDLGLALAAGTVFAVLFGLVIRWYLDRTDAEREDAPPDTAGELGPPRAGRFEKLARLPISPVQRVAVLVVVGAVAAGGWAALPRLDVQARPDQLAAGLPTVDEALHAEEVIGSSGEIRVLVRAKNVLAPETLTWMRQAEEAVVVRYGGAARPIVSPASLLAFLGPEPTPEEITAGRETLPGYLIDSVVKQDTTQAVLSFGVELQDLDDQARLLDGIRAALPPPPPGVTAEVVGLPVAAARGYQLVSDQRYLPNLLGLLAAGLVLAAGLRRRSDALRAVTAAALATGWGLAGAWLVGLDLSPLTVGLGSLTVATACEFSVLLGHATAVGRLRLTVGVAALAATTGYLSLAVSKLAVIREFGLLLAGVVLLSLVAAALVQRLIPPTPERSGPARPRAGDPTVAKVCS
jgi:hypothetical protein